MMNRSFFAPRGAIEKKAPHGSPCTRCGLCCMATLCDLGQAVFRKQRGLCPALLFDADKNSSCGLACDDVPATMRDAAKILIGSGTGCDARFNGEPINNAFYELLNIHDEKTKTETAEARRLWNL